MLKNVVRAICGVAVLSLALNACTKDETNTEDVVKADGKNKKHEFTVEKDGSVNFKAEIVYFEFDDYTLTKQGQERLSALADYLQKHPKEKLKIEGHCDDRGSVEYNLALGQLRSQSVKKYLGTIGVNDKRLAAISFGEERPAETGASEKAWSKNRRAEFTLVSN